MTSVISLNIMFQVVIVFSLKKEFMRGMLLLGIDYDKRIPFDAKLFLQNAVVLRVVLNMYFYVVTCCFLFNSCTCMLLETT